ncbi:alpha-hydroxy-acid oxidizing protein [Treponema sp. C6A8]|uniref:alpha-hydroxy-acid oxidizing protein n=1 Tax=Treponema sp. C6A8 TaxID=1410609 RepID=UPI000481BAEB|nr:alpha-hydroxy-acid oxidizing protein [Treponema sp. C6A8]
MNSKGELKCRRCSECAGFGCIDQLPGLGGLFHNKNFQLNCSAWKDLQKKAEAQGQLEEIKKIEFSLSQIMCAPVTGSQENIGYENEGDFYFPYFNFSRQAGFGVCVGDGCPDEKLKFGIEAVKKIRAEFDPDFKAAFFLKPYPQEVLFERLKKVIPYASHIGVDIDAYNIVTMRNKVHLEKKTAGDLSELRDFANNLAGREIPFVIKGVFTDEDLALVRDFLPEVALVSNHGGRVETREGSSADFLVEHAAELKKSCKEIWVDGGIRNRLDVQTALYYGTSRVLIARPIIRAVFDGENFRL